jgi:hypothetical protein
VWGGYPPHVGLEQVGFQSFKIREFQEHLRTTLAVDEVLSLETVPHICSGQDFHYDTSTRRTDWFGKIEFWHINFLKLATLKKAFNKSLFRGQFLNLGKLLLTKVGRIAIVESKYQMVPKLFDYRCNFFFVKRFPCLAQRLPALGFFLLSKIYTSYWVVNRVFRTACNFRRTP